MRSLLPVLVAAATLGCRASAEESAKARAGVIGMAQAVEMRNAANKGECPSASEVVKSGHVASAKDPWGRDYEVILCSPVLVRSLGKDGKAGTDDDAYSEDWAADKIAKVMVDAFAKEAVEGKRWHTCPSAVDPWGTMTTGTCTKSGATIVSAGPDGEAGTADDVTAEAKP